MVVAERDISMASGENLFLFGRRAGRDPAPAAARAESSNRR